MVERKKTGLRKARAAVSERLRYNSRVTYSTHIFAEDLGQAVERDLIVDLSVYPVMQHILVCFSASCASNGAYHRFSIFSCQKRVVTHHLSASATNLTTSDRQYVHYLSVDHRTPLLTLRICPRTVSPARSVRLRRFRMVDASFVAFLGPRLGVTVSSRL